MEIWKDIKGYEGMYQVSTHGNVKSIDRMVSIGDKQRFNKGGFMGFTCDSDGYFQLHLSKGGVSKVYKVHRLVAEAFLPNPENKPIPNHLSSNKQINHYKNLEWATYSENTQHANDMGLTKPCRTGKPNKRDYKFSDDDILNIRKMRFKDKVSQHSIAKIYKVQ